MAKVIMLCGIPASGKSTASKELTEKYNAVVLSSDAIREELYGDEGIQEDHHKVFSLLHERMRKYLKNGKNVIYDATNINRKRRMHIINQEAKGYHVDAYVFLTPFEEAMTRNQKRKRVVNSEAMSKMYKNFQMPFSSEGFKEVYYHTETVKHPMPSKEEMENVLLKNTNYHELFDKLKQLESFNSIYELAQDSTYHSFTVSRHTYYVYKGIHEGSVKREVVLDPVDGWLKKEIEIEPYTGKNKLKMLYASVFHDLGKGFCKSFFNHEGKEQRYASYLGHENTSCYLAMHYLINIGYELEFVLDVAKLISYHMLPKNMSSKVEKKLKNWLDEESFEELLLFNDYDNAAK